LTIWHCILSQVDSDSLIQLSLLSATHRSDIEVQIPSLNQVI